MQVVELEHSEYVVFTCDTKFPESVLDIYRRFHTQWLPYSGYDVAGIADLEVYSDMNGTSKSGNKLWIAVKKKNRRR